jgi:hypothetical protein
MAQFAAKKLQFAICNVAYDSVKNKQNNRLQVGIGYAISPMWYSTQH